MVFSSSHGPKHLLKPKNTKSTTMILRNDFCCGGNFRHGLETKIKDFISVIYSCYMNKQHTSFLKTIFAWRCYTSTVLHPEKFIDLGHRILVQIIYVKDLADFKKCYQIVISSSNTSLPRFFINLFSFICKIYIIKILQF